MPRNYLILLAVVATGLASGCGANVCDRSQQVNLVTKAGGCIQDLPASLLGDKASCSAGVGACTGDDQALINKTFDCLEKLSTCDVANEQAWKASRQSCLDQMLGLSKACTDGLFQGVPPGQDGGLDGGEVDAGPRPLNDGGAGVELVGVADETTFAFAWTTVQPADVPTWTLQGGQLGEWTEEWTVTPGSLRSTFVDGGPGLTRQFFIVGYNSDGTLGYGNTDAGAVEPMDASVMCQGPLDCTPDLVCDLGQCKVQTCQPGGPNTCPPGYDCMFNGTCNRLISDGGSFDAGISRPDAGRPEAPLPLISNSVELTTAAPVWGAPIPVGGFPGRRQDHVGIDTARVFVAMEQESQVIGHASLRRGADLPDDALSASAIDTVGSRVKVTYNPDSKLVYACYNVGRSVRVRRSADMGRTWGTLAANIDPLGDGGLSDLVTDCDIAPWKNGGVLVATVDNDAIAVRDVSTALSVSPPAWAFLSSGPDAGNIYAPAHPAIATSPDDSVVHVTFTGTRTIPASMVTDTEPYGVFRDGTSGVFSQPQFLSNTGVGTPGTGLAQDWTTVAIEPGTKRAIAAYTSLTPLPQGGGVSATVYVSLFNPSVRQWGTGADLNVFALDTDGNTTLLFPQKLKNDKWDAFSPALAMLPNGRMFLSIVAGPRPMQNADLRLYTMEFGFDVQSPVSTAKGWFVRPIQKVSDMRVWDPRVTNAPPPNVTSFSADRQISTSVTFVEGLGADGEIEGRVMMHVRP